MHTVSFHTVCIDGKTINIGNKERMATTKIRYVDGNKPFRVDAVAYIYLEVFKS